MPDTVAPVPDDLLPIAIRASVMELRAGVEGWGAATTTPTA
jgi:hypothetical protein